MSEISSVFLKFGANPMTRRTYRDLLANHVRRWDTIVSFNYDTVFEHSLQRNRRWHYEGIEGRANSLPVLKPHGSANWTDGAKISVEDAPAHAVIVAPTHLKFIETSGTDGSGGAPGYLDQSPQIQDVWARMEQEMRRARALVFIGYSFPAADLYFSSVLRSVLATGDRNPAIVIVNPDAIAIEDRLRLRFRVDTFDRYFDLGMFIQTRRGQILDRIS